MIRSFQDRHIGISAEDQAAMLKTIGVNTLQELIDKTIPPSIQMEKEMVMDEPMTERDYLEHIKALGAKNKVFKTYIGQGYYGTLTPSVILRNVFENPGWYTQYTPYQAEIAQGRLESLLNFQTMVSDLTGLPIANASLLDEGTAAAEGMAMLFHAKNKKAVESPVFLVDEKVYAQTLTILRTRARHMGIEIQVADLSQAVVGSEVFAVMVQYPSSTGELVDWASKIALWQSQGVRVLMATDLLALTLIQSPGELGVDVAVGNSQRFGVPLGYGGPHAAFFACKDEYKRDIPGRIIGISEDADGHRALRMALQTREQHIRREKATSNICTAQALLANMAAMYAVYHGPDGLRAIANQVHQNACDLAASLLDMGYEIVHKSFFDTIAISGADAKTVRVEAEKVGINFAYKKDLVLIALDETVRPQDLVDILDILAKAKNKSSKVATNTASHIPSALTRTSSYLQHDVFNHHHSETQMMRYIKQLENKDLALNTSMISLGSCTMKLNAATQLMPLSWTEWGSIHPYVPHDQAMGYHDMISGLSQELCTITGFDGCSLQPNSGAQGEYAGLYTIVNYHQANNQAHRNVVLIPISAHGTNPASAAMMGLKIVIVACDEKGNINVDDLRQKAEENKENLSALMVTYPSTHGVFEESIKEICQIIHDNGGQVYMDGANMNAQVGYTSPAIIGADVCHLNLHKTFAIPHGGGGPGMGPICVKSHLIPHLPQNPDQENPDVYAVSAAEYGSALILLISYAYIKMLGAVGLRQSTATAILNANYMKALLQPHYSILYAGSQGMCAHEFILDLRPFKANKIEAEDVAKRLMDFNFHAPTLSFPVAGTFMIEPTESEDKAELDRFCEAMIAIRAEIESVLVGSLEKENSPLHYAPHTYFVATQNEWDRKYTREQAVFALPFVKKNKFWPSISRINNTLGDRHLVCTCAPTEDWV